MNLNVKFAESKQSFECNFGEIIDNTRKPVVEPLTVTENGEYSPSENVDGFNPVKVAVPLRYDEGYNNGYNEGFAASQESIKLQEKTATENGEVTADEEYTALKKVIVAVPIKEEQTKTVEITKNGTTEVVADEGKAMSKVTVNTNVAFEGDIGKPYIDTSKITDFKYFCQNNRMNDFVDYIDTSKSTNFSYMFFNCTSLTTIPPLDTSNGTDFSYMFSSCKALTTIPPLDTSKSTNLRDMFNNCNSLTTIPPLDTSKSTNFSYMFNNCYSLTSIPQLDTSNGMNFNTMFSACTSLTTIPPLNTSKGVNFGDMFNSCKALTTIPPLDTSNGTTFSYMFNGCTLLETITLTTAKSNLTTNTFSSCKALKNITIGEGWAVNIYLHYSNNLTVESLHGMIENLADLTGKTAKTFQIGATNLAKVDEEHIQMLTAKNWIYQ